MMVDDNYFENLIDDGCFLADCIKMVPRGGPYKPSRGVPLAVIGEA